MEKLSYGTGKHSSKTPHSKKKTFSTELFHMTSPSSRKQGKTKKTATVLVFKEAGASMATLANKEIHL